MKIQFINNWRGSKYGWGFHLFDIHLMHYSPGDDPDNPIINGITLVVLGFGLRISH